MIAQTRTRLAGDIPDGSAQVVSLHDPDARPIRKGRLGRPVEFGYKAQVADNADGIVIDHVVVIGNPPDAPMLAPAVARIKVRFGRAPKAVTPDRGYGEAAVDAALVDLGVTTVAITRRGRPGPARTKLQRERSFVRLVKWRTGSEVRINCLKRDYGWRRTLLDSHVGAQTWCGWGVLPTTPAKSPSWRPSPANTAAIPAATTEPTCPPRPMLPLWHDLADRLLPARPDGPERTEKAATRNQNG